MSQHSTPTLYGPQIVEFISKHLRSAPLKGFDNPDFAEAMRINCARLEGMTADELLADVNAWLDYELANMLNLGALAVRARHDGSVLSVKDAKYAADHGLVELLTLCLHTPPQHWRALQQLPAGLLRQMVGWSAAAVVRFCTSESGLGDAL